MIGKTLSKFDDKQKIEVLKEILKRFKKKAHTSRFMCLTFQAITGINLDETFIYIPELLKYKPKGNDFAWFNSSGLSRRIIHKKKIRILKKTIKDIKSKNRISWIKRILKT